MQKVSVHETFTCSNSSGLVEFFCCQTSSKCLECQTFCLDWEGTVKVMAGSVRHHACKCMHNWMSVTLETAHTTTHLCTSTSSTVQPHTLDLTQHCPPPNPHARTRNQSAWEIGVPRHESGISHPPIYNPPAKTGALDSTHAEDQQASLLRCGIWRTEELLRREVG